MNQTAEGSGASFMEKVSAFIVDKRSLIFLITIILLIFSAFSRNWVEVESDLTYYLPEDSETKQALYVMDEQFITYGTAKIMVANITLDEAAALNDTIKSIRGVQMVDYDETEDHYKKPLRPLFRHLRLFRGQRRLPHEPRRRERGACVL